MKDTKWSGSYAVSKHAHVCEYENNEEPVGFCDEYRWKCECIAARDKWAEGHARDSQLSMAASLMGGGHE